MPRDSSGNYTLPSGINPVVDGTIISTDWANPTLSDIATQLNNVLTRDGLLGPVAPLFIVDGTPSLPGLAFNSQNGTGWWRDPTKVGFSYGGVTSFTVNGSGLSPVQPVGFPNGTELLPSITFATETSTGVFRESAGVMAWSIAGTKKMSLSANQLTVDALLVKADNQALAFTGATPAIIWNNGTANTAEIKYASNTLNISGLDTGGLTLQTPSSAIRYVGTAFSPNVAYGINLGTTDLPWASTYSNVYNVRSGGAAIGNIAFNNGFTIFTEAGQPFNVWTGGVHRIAVNSGLGSTTFYGSGNQLRPAVEAAFQLGLVGNYGMGFQISPGASEPDTYNMRWYAQVTNSGGFPAFAYRFAISQFQGVSTDVMDFDAMTGIVSVFSQGAGGLLEVGYRDVPRTDVIGGWQITREHRGRMLYSGDSGNINLFVTNGAMVAGDVVSILRLVGSGTIIGQNGLLLYTSLGGPGPQVGIRANGCVTLWVVDGGLIYVSGDVE